MHASIAAIEYFLPAATITSAELAAVYPDWPADKIESKTGIQTRHIAQPGVCASDMAVEAARKLFAAGACDPAAIDYILFCTQTADYIAPATACLLQQRLGIGRSAGALDFNLACSGNVYGLGLGEGLIASGQASNVLLITADTLTQFIHPQDKSLRLLFGDAAAATLLRATSGDEPSIGPFVYGTDGAGAPNLMIPMGGMRSPRSRQEPTAVEDDFGNARTGENLFMNGVEVFNFTAETVPASVNKLFERANLDDSKVDLYLFHQAGKPILEFLRKRMRIPPEKFVMDMADCGNTSSSTIPIALKRSVEAGRLQPGARVVLVGFGVGYSWAATAVRWT
jgi:3-oxoacyl-[acyl-carrier-protein] synthase-3